ncbi:TetR/AcrR family transcriptional regulator [Mucilaginibacter arboris]|uniref:TetR family transcriptional regulator n=1 Tax=Mucilaginibacter arboris TaxID=2682090 RepID=A0A7K1SXE0_9SPHI|nr:TetR/AcrR family transcriptional regulator [Mucilaginibacter arboris]MVN21700.1 TetR family transcriptional regulator [Mucilaginibacter arboris]
MSNSSDPQEIKKDQILNAAYRRFSHYGYSKTTMNDIAGDLSMSKALLYYYFPDKSRLYAGVIRKLSGEYLTALKHKVQKSSTIDEAFFFILQKMHQTISSHYNFFDYIKLNQQNLPELIWNVIQEVHETEVSLLTELYRKQEGEAFAKKYDLKQLIQLIFKSLETVGTSTHKQKTTFFPDAEQLEVIYTQKKLLLQILLNGLKSL